MRRFKSGDCLLAFPCNLLRSLDSAYEASPSFVQPGSQAEHYPPFTDGWCGWTVYEQALYASEDNFHPITATDPLVEWNSVYVYRGRLYR